MDIFYFNKYKQKCPWHEEGDCTGQIIDVYTYAGGYEERYKTELSYESCDVRFCPMAYWLGVADDG